MAVTTLDAHCSRAIDFYKKNDVFFGIGKSSAWTEEELGDRITIETPYEGESYYEGNPPVPYNTDKMINPLGYKKVESIFIVKPDEEGELEYRGEKWKIVSVDNAIAEGAHWIYVSTALSYSELPVDMVYRQVGLYTNLTRKSGIAIDKYSLLPEEVESQGILEILDNRKPVYRQYDQKEYLRLVIEF